MVTATLSGVTYADCAGTYQRTEDLVHTKPVWNRISPDDTRFMFYGSDGLWHVTASSYREDIVADSGTNAGGFIKSDGSADEWCEANWTTANATAACSTLEAWRLPPPPPAPASPPLEAGQMLLEGTSYGDCAGRYQTTNAEIANKTVWKRVVPDGERFIFYGVDLTWHITAMSYFDDVNASGGNAGGFINSADAPDEPCLATWTGTGLTAICTDTVLSTVPPPPPPSQISVHGDPMFKQNGAGTRFAITSGKLTPLLKWKSQHGIMQLHGKTMEKSGHQWFKQLIITQDDATVLDVTARQTSFGTMQVLLDGKEIEESPRKEWVATYASRKRAVHLSALKQPARLQIGEKLADKLELEAGGLKLTIYSSKASKFFYKADQVKYMHLNVDFDEGIPTDARGVFAQMAGVEPMSRETKRLLTPYPRAAQHKHALQP